MSDFTITVTGTLYEDIANHIYFEKRPIQEIEDVLDEPCNMKWVLLCSNIAKQHYRLFNVENLSNREVCEKIYRFYRHKTYRRLIGDHILMNGWFRPRLEEPDVFEPVNYDVLPPI